ncbi:MAG: hypothetical protein MHM6MM_002610 [Cercozoa sp. M6MM]
MFAARTFVYRSFAQRLAMSSICTHSGSFHADESLACALLRKTDRFAGAEVRRSRDPEVWAQCDILVDVGAEYDISNSKFDHHQRGFEETFDTEHSTKLSSAGLIYKHFGREILQKMTGYEGEQLKLLFQKMYDSFIEEMDAIDNGISRYETHSEPRYSTAGTDLAARVSKLNPRWNEEGVDVDARFKQAMALCESEFDEAVDYYVKSWFPAKQIVVDAMNTREQVHPSGSIVLLKQFCPWKGHLHSLEGQMALGEQIKYVLYPDTSGKFRVQAVAKEKGSFESRLALPEPWRGIRGDALSQLTGIEGCIFVHASGFIGGNDTKEGALAMASKALAMLQ